jgi:hypothetical protein
LKRRACCFGAARLIADKFRTKSARVSKSLASFPAFPGIVGKEGLCINETRCREKSTDPEVSKIVMIVNAFSSAGNIKRSEITLPKISNAVCKTGVTNQIFVVHFRLQNRNLHFQKEIQNYFEFLKFLII